ncbi:hypothetical protein L195_g036238 [Trifolium pratense]|uniref:Senescence regulator n=2 Tax=Trifolium pratense TaxID=57577 RepID=A0A2K3LNX6_TRIPR|nr:uncharacterized protein LOC123896359 [Trifolium pratense]PNX80241.1 hypothetical protein L195_g036238 [Trifolium pratense]CAJ2658733.1 unnamed protein product [Trifolium pratense]
MAEEFFESEVVFSDQIQSGAEEKELVMMKKVETEAEAEADHHQASEKKKMVVKSKPMNIPEGMFKRLDNGYEDEEEMVPPHVIMARRLAEKMTYSMCYGNGRTLKGRDLSRVRNSVLRMTGFIEV